MQLVTTSCIYTNVKPQNRCSTKLRVVGRGILQVGRLPDASVDSLAQTLPLVCGTIQNTQHTAETTKVKSIVEENFRNFISSTTTTNIKMSILAYFEANSALLYCQISIVLSMFYQLISLCKNETQSTCEINYHRQQCLNFSFVIGNSANYLILFEYPNFDQLPE